jgi:uncharacterized protein YutE (UPF0331/DUF86 family)
MNLENKQVALVKQLDLNLELLNKAQELMRYSQNRCQAIIKKAQHSDEELESCEALTSRFARTADILTQKILTSIFLLLQEMPKTFIDKCNLAEKLGIIDNATDLIKIRELRNEIAHEYRRTDLIELFSEIFAHSGKLDEIIASINIYVEELHKKLH